MQLQLWYKTFKLTSHLDMNYSTVLYFIKLWKLLHSIFHKIATFEVKFLVFILNDSEQILLNINDYIITKRLHSLMEEILLGISIYFLSQIILKHIITIECDNIQESFQSRFSVFKHFNTKSNRKLCQTQGQWLLLWTKCLKVFETGHPKFVQFCQALVQRPKPKSNSTSK